MQFLNSRSDKFIHGEDALYIYIVAEDVGRIQRVSLTWNYDGLVIDPGSVCGLFCNDHLYVSSVEISELNNYPES
jgi:pancreatic triacylglycerol lipase